MIVKISNSKITIILDNMTNIGNIFFKYLEFNIEIIYLIRNN